MIPVSVLHQAPDNSSSQHTPEFDRQREADTQPDILIEPDGKADSSSNNDSNGMVARRF